jgi:hypothetical protein
VPCAPYHSQDHYQIVRRCALGSRIPARFRLIIHHLSRDSIPLRRQGQPLLEQFRIATVPKDQRPPTTAARYWLLATDYFAWLFRFGRFSLPHLTVL